MKDHLIFDTTDATTIAATDSVGAYIRSSDGTLFTHTTVGSKEALDVRIAEGINVEVDLDQSDDSVAIGDGTTLFGAAVEDVAAGAGHSGFASMAVQDAVLSALGSIDGDFTHLRTNANGALWVEFVNSSIAVTATDLDIRDLTHVSDSVKIGDGTDFLAVAADGSIAVTDNGGSLTVDGTVAATQSGTWTVGLSEDHNYGAVGASTLRTAAQIGNATGAADFGSGATTAQTLRVALASDTGDVALANSAIANAVNTMSVANTAENVVASPLANRKYLLIYNNKNKTTYIGASGVSAANGFPLSPGSRLELRAGAAVDIEWVAEDTSQELRTLELS